MHKPTNIQDLAEQLQHAKFNRITAICDLIGATTAVDFFDEIQEDNVNVSPEFARYIPVIKEVVSTKKHDYTLTTHVVFWLADGEPYIYTPAPTIEHNRAGSTLKQLKRGAHLMIPHNCKRYDILALRDGCLKHDGSSFLDLTITVNKVKGL